MKIAMIGQKGIPAVYGGVERHVEDLAGELVGQGHEVLVYARKWYSPMKGRYKGIRVITTPTLHSKHLDTIIHTFTATIHALFQKPDVIHYHGVGPSLLSWIPRVFAPHIKVVATFHCIDRKHQKWNFFARFMLGIGEWMACAFPHETIVVSKTLQSYCDNRYNALTEYIPNGVDVPKRAGVNVLKKFGLEKNGYVLMVSRLIRHKGAHYLIDAYNQLERQKATQGKKLVIVGSGVFTEDYEAEIQELAAGNSNIVLTGALGVADTQQLFSHAAVVVHPSEWEGLPIVVLEGMSHGKLVIASDIPENMEVTRVHGLNFHNRSAKDLARKLRFALAHPDYLASRGVAAKRFVLGNYRWDMVARATEKLYESLLEERQVQAMPIRVR